MRRIHERIRAHHDFFAFLGIEFQTDATELSCNESVERRFKLQRKERGGVIFTADNPTFDKLLRHRKFPNDFFRFYVAITTLFFDLDGTISNNFLGIERCLNFGLTRLGLRTLSPEEVHPLVGPPFRESLPKLFPGVDVEAMLRLYRERYEMHGWVENELYAGIAESIRTLHLQGFTIALCTSKPRIFAEKIIAHFDLARYFDGIHGPELDGRFDKKTDLLAHLVKQYKVAPAQALMIGDRDKDIEAARHAGTHSLGVLWGFGNKAELQNAGASRIIAHPSELQHTVHSIA
jgi:phosphoglycolate phosphatase